MILLHKWSSVTGKADSNSFVDTRYYGTVLTPLLTCRGEGCSSINPAPRAAHHTRASVKACATTCTGPLSLKSMENFVFEQWRSSLWVLSAEDSSLSAKAKLIYATVEPKKYKSVCKQKRTNYPSLMQSWFIFFSSSSPGGSNSQLIIQHNIASLQN